MSGDEDSIKKVRRELEVAAEEALRNLPAQKSRDAASKASRGPVVWSGEADAIRDALLDELAEELAPELKLWEEKGDRERWFRAVDEAHRRMVTEGRRRLREIEFYLQ